MESVLLVVVVVVVVLEWRRLDEGWRGVELGKGTKGKGDFVTSNHSLSLYTLCLSLLSCGY